MASARDVLVERAARDVEETLEHLQARLRQEPGGLVRAMEIGVLSLVGLLDPRGRIGRDLDKLLAVVARLQKGESAETLAREELHETLRVWELNLVVRVKDPTFERILEVSERIFRERLPDLARLASVEDPEDYPDLVRRAFPDRAHPDALVEQNGREVLAILDLVEADPQVVRVPRAWVPKLLRIAREMVLWKLDQVRRELDDIYGARPPPA